MRTAPHKPSSEGRREGQAKPRFKCSERVVLRYGDTALETQCLEIGEDTLLLEAEDELAPSQEVWIEIPSQHIRRDGEVRSCVLQMGLFRLEVALRRGQYLDPIAITMYPLLQGPK